MSTDLVTCSMCRGTGKTFYICANRMIDCSDCKGTGKRAYRPPEWLEVGNRLRAIRVAAGLSLRDEAKRRGIGIVELSEMEHGKREPAE